mmetsp:Transcript_41918/g.115587  ORF Transcript_41918/g.115587 Transcript_41918/m.115587 type:complete len:222 (+) Transcript_41918:701-1366(+)
MGLALSRMDLENIELCPGEHVGIEPSEPRGHEENHDLVLLGHTVHLVRQRVPEKLCHALHVGQASALRDLIRGHLLVRLDGVKHHVIRTQRNLRDVVDCGREGGGEKGALPFRCRWQRFDDFRDRIAEAHVKKLVGFVQTQERQTRDARLKGRRVVQVILKTTGRRHEDVARLGSERVVVSFDVRAAIEAHDAEPFVVAEQDFRLIGDLLGKLARRRENHR